MKRFETHALSLAAALLAVAALGLTSSASSLRAGAAAQKAREDVGQIKLVMSEGDCTVDDVALIKTKRKAKLRWDVSNSCEEEATVGVENFILDDDENDPLVDCEGNKRDVLVKPGKTGNIRCKIKDAADYGTYEYDVTLDGDMTLDPKLEIDR